MSNSETSTRVPYNGNGSTTTIYPIPWKYFSTTHNRIYADSTDITSTTTFTGDGSLDNPTGGFQTALAYDPSVLVVAILDMPMDQPTVMVEGGAFPAKTVEEQGYDRLNMQSRSIKRNVDNSLKVEDGTGKEANRVKREANTSLGFGSSSELVARTEEETKTWLNLTGTVIDRPNKVWSDDGQRALAVPDYIGQDGHQLDAPDKNYYSTGPLAGNWAVKDIQYETGVIFPDEPNTTVLREAGGGALDKYELWNSGANTSIGSSAHTIPSGMGRNNWSHLLTWNLYLDTSAGPAWKQAINTYQTQMFEMGVEGLSFHCVKNLGAGGSFSGENHMVWSVRPNNIQHGGQIPGPPEANSELRQYQDNFPLIQPKVMSLHVLNHYNIGESSSGWYEPTNPFAVYASDCRLGNARFQDKGAIAIRSWGGTVGNQDESLSIVFDKARANSWDQTASLDGDIVGQIKFRTWDGAKWLGQTKFKVVAEGDVGVDDGSLQYQFGGGKKASTEGNYMTLGKNGIELGGENDGSTYQDLTLSNNQRNTNFSGLGVAQYGYGQITQSSGGSGGFLIRGMTDREEQGFPLLFQGVSGITTNSAITNPIITFRAYSHNGTGGISTPNADSTIASFELGATQKVSIDGNGHIVATGVITNGSYTVAGLPTVAASSSCYVTDGSVVHAGNSGSIVAGSGSNFLPVYFDGTNWRIS